MIKGKQKNLIRRQNRRHSTHPVSLTRTTSRNLNTNSTVWSINLLETKVTNNAISCVFCPITDYVGQTT